MYFPRVEDSLIMDISRVFPCSYVFTILRFKVRGDGILIKLMTFWILSIVVYFI